MDNDALSPSQQEALSQLQALTNGGDADVAQSVLESVDWDVQRAANIVFESAPTAPLSIPSIPGTSIPGATYTNTHTEAFEIDDSEQDGLLSGRPSGREFPRISPSSSILSLLLRPLRIIIALLAVPYTILRVVLRTLHIPLPLPPVPLSFSITGLGLNFGLSPRPSLGPAPVRDAKTASERWVRALEEETGCVSISRAQMAGGEASGVASSSAPGLSRRTGDESPSSSRVLPDFFIGSYESFVKACAKETEPKIGCAVLVSDEHDDVAEFKRSTLTDPDFVRLLQENDILIWGGDIRDRDAWGAAQKLQATTYPFVAFVALQPRRGSSAIAQNKSILTILSRHQGPSIPTSSGPTSPSTLTTHIADHLLPRVTPVLAQLQSTATERDAALAVATRARERERALRAEQDRAFAESARRDKERIERKMQEEREGKEEERRRSMEEERVKEEQRKREEQRKMWEEKRMAWRRWGRRAFVPREPRPSEQGRGRTVRIGVRMPDGRRAVRFFGQMDSLTAVYAFVDTLFIPEGKAFSSDFDPLTAPDGASSSADESGLMHAISTMTEGRTEEWWGFKLVTTYPRKEVQWEPERKVGEVEGLKSGGQLVVELVDGEYGSVKGKERERRSLESRVVSAKGSESDEYETESD